MNKEFVYKEFLRRENNVLRAPYNPELEFYSIIKSGNIKDAKARCSESFVQKQGLGTLSDDQLQNLKYHLVITIAMIARYCIEGGMDVSTSYGLSDYYIQKADACKTPEDIDTIHSSVVLDYVQRMRHLRKKKICSMPVAKCIDFIYDNLHHKITVTDLANYVNLNPSYLSRLFKKETGNTVSNYIQDLKIDTAKNMLLYSDYSSAEIASILAFSDQSYFTEVFRKTVGLSPVKYKCMHLRETEISSLE